MGLSSALATAMSGLRANQAALSITSGNIANAQTPGYIAETANQTELATGTGGSTVQVAGITRDLDTFVQKQLRTENAGAGFADQTSNILSQLQSLYGTPGGTGTLETAFDNFTSALQSLSTSSSGLSAQTTALGDAQTLAQQLNTTSEGIQTLRTNVEQDIGTSVTQANNDLKQIASLNQQLQGLAANDPSAATLEDQRDNAINDLSSLMDVNAVTDSANQVSILTNTGVQLVSGTQASQFSFTSPGSLSATSLYSSNPSQNGVGSLTLTLPNGSSIDAIANNVISSGRIAADIQLRDTTLVQAQNQVDQLAASMASSLSNVTTQGTAVSQAVAPGTLSGFTLDLSNMLPGNTINLTYTNSAGQQQAVQIVDVTDPSALPLPSPAGANPQVIGINFSNGISSIVSQLNAALGSTHLQFAANPPGGNTLQIAANSADNTTVNSASTTTTITGLTSGNPQLAVFTDAGGTPYTGAVTGSGSELTGFAGRIAVNPALLADPSALTVYNNNPTTPAGDNTRSNFLFSQLTSATSTYSPQSGLGSAAAPFTGTVGNYLQQFLSLQANAAASATNLQQGQAVVVSTLQQKFNSTSEVSIDSEMSNLIALQNSYAANAHCMSVVQSMMQTLMQVQL